MLRSIHSIGYSSDVISRYITIKIGEHNILPIQVATLAQLYYAEKDMTLKDLCVGLFRSPNAVSSLVNKMKKAGLVKKQTSKHDHRFQTVTLTDKGKKLHLKLEPIIAKISEDILNDMNPDSIINLEERLLIIRDKLLKKVGPPSSWATHRK